jgi:UDP-N-acetyl-D-galactosamine dehydrogenase
MNERIAVIGLGYVGLPVALAFAKKFPQTIGFDIDKTRIHDLRHCVDRTGEFTPEELRSTNLYVTDDPTELRGTTFFVIAVPTPVNRANRPDLSALMSASEIVGNVLAPGAVVVYESTVYPGVTEEICGPILERVSGLRRGVDFKIGYSPERINPGDKEHTLEKIVKVVSGEDEEALERIAAAYSQIVEAGIHRTPSIKVAEAAKVIENTQRDLNIALMNELAIIFDRMGIRTRDVLEAAGTKWNFLRFTPGLVGGHCIGVDPYYLTAKAEELSYHPHVILAGRRINDDMGRYIAERVVRMLVHADVPLRQARVGILGLTFKENVRDLRNTGVMNIITTLRDFGIEPMVHDPLADPEDALKAYNVRLWAWNQLRALDGMILAVAHQAYVQMSPKALLSGLRPGGVLADVKSLLDPDNLPKPLNYWSL